MIVKELIEQLQELDQDKEVWAEGDGGSHYPIRFCREQAVYTNIILNRNTREVVVLD